MTALRVCFVGDSITNGTLDEAGQGWPGRLAAAELARGHELTQYNLGVRAETSRQIARRWRRECAARLPDAYPGALVFSFGVNDMVEENGAVRVPPDDSLTAARAIISGASSWKPVLWVSPVPGDMSQQPFSPARGISYSFDNARTAALNGRYAELAHELEVPYLDVFTPLAASDVWAAALEAGDGVHPSAEGYALIAGMVGEWRYWRRWLE